MANRRARLIRRTRDRRFRRRVSTDEDTPARYEALRFRQGSTVVTTVARFGFPGVPSFRAVDDLEPYFAGYTRFVLSWLRFWET